jgi:NAD(P)-dependent dehydrogenase (short-subunit alcohol dehydrogenase family)
MRSFKGETILITGAGAGIGGQLARRLASEGARIAAIDLKPEGLAQLTAELPAGQVATAIADVTDRAGLNPAIEKLQQQLGPIDVLIANAGIGSVTPALNFSAAAVEAQVRVNLIGVANSIDAVLLDMLRRRQGQIVAISSLASYRGLPLMAGYCASKAGLNAMLDSLRVELKQYGITVTTVCPGWVRTAMTSRIGLPDQSLQSPEAAAESIVAAIRCRTPFRAFPRRTARALNALRILPCMASDWFVGRMIPKKTRVRGT